MCCLTPRPQTGRPTSVRPPPQRQRWIAHHPVANLRLGPKGTGGAKRSRSNSTTTDPWWETAAQSFSICSESTNRLEWRFFFLGGGEGEAEDDGEAREDVFLRGLLSRVRRPVSLGTEPWGEDTATSLPEDDGKEHCAGVRDTERSVETWERCFSSLRFEKDAQNCG
ncbi:UNVERIFIED_CONTAM: hypothetical protein FKN15_006594 [Acipenser sinensis]